MNKHASMNRSFRLVWSKARGQYIVASELARGRSKASCKASAPVLSALVAGLGLAGISGLAGAQVVPATTVVPTGGNTHAYISPNGVPVVNINTANSAGVSHNQYTRYDVEANGLVLNNGNSAQSARQSQLAGQVVANINLAAEARVILNEVVSTRRSTLAGFTEVVGGKADVMVANPYGITCAGCGFINSDRVTLTTGTPNFGYDGSVAGFSVHRGDILVNGGGLNASAQQILDLVTRSVKIDAQINTAPGGSLGIVTGLNTWSYGAREVTGSTTAADETPSFAIDSTALGGIYAGRIRLIATEAGVGVRMLGDAAASVDDFTLSSAGKVEIRSKISAERDLALASTAAQGDALNLIDANVSARRNASLTAIQGGATLSGGVLVASNDLSFGLGSLLDTASNASIDDNNKRFAGNAFTQNVSGAANINGVSYGAGKALSGEFGSLTVGADGAALYGGTTLALTTKTGNLALGTASLSAENNLDLTAETGAISIGSGDEQGIQSVTGDIGMSAAAGLTNSGTLSADGGNVRLRANGTIGNSGTMHAAQNVDIADMQGGAGENLNNSGTVIADGALVVKGAALVNTGTLQGTQGTTLAAESLGNSGIFVASATVGQSGSFTLGSLDNQGTLQSSEDLSLAVRDTLANSGKLLATDDLGITAGSGAMLAATNAGTGVIQAGDVLTLTGNAGGSNTTLSNQGGTLSGNALNMTLATLTNSGTVQGGSATDSAVKVAGTLSNQAGGKLLLATAGSGGGTVEANSLVNAGIVQSQGDLAVRIGSQLDNQTGAQILAGGGMNVRGITGSTYAVTSNGRMQAGTLLDIKGYGNGNAVNVTVGSGGVLIGDTMEVTANSLTLENGGVTTSAGNMTLALSDLYMGGSSARIVAATNGAGTANLTLANGYANVGAIHSGGDLNLQGPSITNTATGGISALGTLTVNATAGNLANAGALYAGQQLNASASNNLNNAAVTGTIDSSGSMNLTAGNTFINNGEINAGQDIAITAPVFRNEITGGVPDRLWTAIDWSPTEMYDHYESGYYNEYFHYRANGVRSQYFSRAVSDVKPQIIAGRNMSISGFNAGYNSGGVLAASNGTMTITGSGSFTNDDLNLVTEQWKKQWYDWADCGLFWLDCDYYNGVDYAEWRTSSSTAYSGTAGIFAQTLNASGFALVNHSAVWGAVPGSRSATGAGSSTLTTGSAAVDSATAVSFSGLVIKLPTNPNGYFVTSQDPQAKYLVETNPLFDVGSNFVGSDYLAVRLGINPDTVQKRLGDSNYEAYLIRQQLIDQTGKNILKGYGDEAAQMQRLMDQGAAQGAALGLKFGQAPTAAQLANLKEDMVWMVETEVAGQKVLAPVVYLAASTKAMVEGGAVIAGEEVNLDVASLTNTGGTIRGDNSLDIKSKGDVANISGTIKGGDVSVSSTEGSIRNETLASTTGNNNNAATNIGKTAGIEATGNLNLDAAKDITVKGADVKGGGDVSLAAGNNVTFDTIENKTASTTHSKVGGFLSSGVESKNVITTTNIGSNLGAGGNLTIKSGKDTTIAGSKVDVGGNLNVDAAGNFNVLSKQDTVETNTKSTVSGIGVGGGLFGTSETVTNNFQGRNAASTINVGGDASLTTANTLTVQGSELNITGNAAIKADDVQVLAGRDEDRTTSTTTTTTFLKIEGPKGETSAGAGAGARAGADSMAKGGNASAGAGASAEAGAQASASGSVGLSLAETSTTNTFDLSQRSVGSALNIGGNLAIDSNKSITLQGANVEVGGDADLKAKDIKVLASQDVNISTSKTTTTSIGIYVDSTNSAEAGASAGAGASAYANSSADANGLGGSAGAGAQAHAGAQANASASSDTNIDIVRTKTTESESLNITNTGSVLKVGGKLNATAENKLTVQGSDISGEQGVSVKAKDMEFLAAEDVSYSSTKTTTVSAGLYITGNAQADAGANASVQADAAAQGGLRGGLNQDSAQASLSGSASAEAGAGASAKIGAGIQTRTNSTTTTEGSTTARVSSIRSGSGSIERVAENRILDQGTEIEAAGDFTQSATTIDSVAARNTSFSTTESESHTARVGVYLQGNAEARASASAEGNAGAGYLGGNTLGMDASSSAEAGANASAGVEAQYTMDKSGSSSSSSQAVVSTIKAGGKVSSTSSGKTTFEGTKIEGGTEVDIAAKEIDFKAARDTETSSENAMTIGAAANLGLNLGSDGAVEGGASGSFNKDDASSSSSTAVVGSIQSGGKLNIRTEGDARFEGTEIGAAGDASIAAGGDLKMEAARNESSESGRNINAEASVSISRSGGGAQGGESSKGMGFAAAGGYSNETSSSTEAVTGSINVGGNLTLSAGKNASFEGTAISAGGDTDLAAGGNVTFEAARNTSSSESTSVSASVELGKSNSSNAGTGEASSSSSASFGAEAGYGREKSSEAVTGSLETGGNLRIRSGGDTTFVGTDLAAGGSAAVEAGGNVNFKAAESTSESFNVGGSVGMAGSTTNTTPGKVEAPPAGAGAAAAAAGVAKPAAGAAEEPAGPSTERERSGSFGVEAGYSTSTERKGGSISAGSGGLQISAGKNANFEGTKLSSEGDAGINAGGDVNFTTARSTSSSIGGSIGGEAESKSNTGDPTQDSSTKGGSIGIEAGLSSTHEGASIESGGKLNIASGGRTTLVNTEMKADEGTTIAAAGGVSRSTVSDSELTVKMSAAGQTEKTNEAPVAAANPDEAGQAGPAAETKPEAAEAESAKPDTDKPAAAKTEAAKTEAAKKEAAKKEAAKKEAAKKEAAKKEAAKKEAAKKEAAKKEAAKKEAAKKEAEKKEAEKKAASASASVPAKVKK